MVHAQFVFAHSLWNMESLSFFHTIWARLSKANQPSTYDTLYSSITSITIVGRNTIATSAPNGQYGHCKALMSMAANDVEDIAITWPSVSDSQLTIPKPDTGVLHSPIA